MYKITIVKTEKNPNFAEEMVEYQKNNRMYDRGNYSDRGEPRENIPSDALMVELTDEQYKKVKAEIIKAFE